MTSILKWDFVSRTFMPSSFPLSTTWWIRFLWYHIAPGSSQPTNYFWDALPRFFSTGLTHNDVVQHSCYIFTMKFHSLRTSPQVGEIFWEVVRTSGVIVKASGSLEVVSSHDNILYFLPTMKWTTSIFLSLFFYHSVLLNPIHLSKA